VNIKMDLMKMNSEHTNLIKLAQSGVIKSDFIVQVMSFHYP